MAIFGKLLKFLRELRPLSRPPKSPPTFACKPTQQTSLLVINSDLFTGGPHESTGFGIETSFKAGRLDFSGFSFAFTSIDLVLNVNTEIRSLFSFRPSFLFDTFGPTFAACEASSVCAASSSRRACSRSRSFRTRSKYLGTLPYVF